MARQPRVAWVSLTGCSGCELTLLGTGPAALDLLSRLEIVHMPLLIDFPLDSQDPDGPGASMDMAHGVVQQQAKVLIPDCDLALVSGCAGTTDDLALLHEARIRATALLAIGTCACFGGVPALRNLPCPPPAASHDECGHLPGTRPPDNQEMAYPGFELARVRAVSEQVEIDGLLPGCPPQPEALISGLQAFLEGVPLPVVEYSACALCPSQRQGKALPTIQRRPGPPGLFAVSAAEAGRCLLERGHLCLGPVTRGGCGGPEGTPRCLRAGMPCRGCFGPLVPGTHPMVEMLGLLVSLGLDIRETLDRAGVFNSYAGLTSLPPPPGYPELLPPCAGDRNKPGSQR